MNMKNKMKIIVTITLLSVMLLGGVITAHAATCPPHETEPKIKLSTVAGQTTHDYLKEIRHNIDGTTTYIYGLCTVTSYSDKYDYVCTKCNAVTGSGTGTHVTHSVSH